MSYSDSSKMYLPTDLVTEIASHSSFDQLYLFNLTESSWKFLLSKELAYIFYNPANIKLLNKLSRLIDLLNRFLTKHKCYSIAVEEILMNDFQDYLEDEFYYFMESSVVKIQICRLNNLDYLILLDDGYYIRSNYIDNNRFPIYLANLLLIYKLKIRDDPIGRIMDLFQENFDRNLPNC